MRVQIRLKSVVIRVLTYNRTFHSNLNDNALLPHPAPNWIRRENSVRFPQGTSLGYKNHGDFRPIKAFLVSWSLLMHIDASFISVYWSSQSILLKSEIIQF